MFQLDQLTNELNPEKIIQISLPGPGLKAVVVIDNVARGPAIGGTRMAPDVTVEECARLAKAMTLKNAMADLPHGGAKSVISADPSMPKRGKEAVIRAFASAISDIKDYIPGPDMGTNEEAMAWIYDEIGRSVGLPREFGGIPLDEIGATGYGLAIAAEVVQEFSKFELQGARIVVQGWGAVGQHAARFLTERGAILVGAADSRGSIINPSGLDVEDLIIHKAKNLQVSDYPHGDNRERDAIVSVPCDIWIPAARPDVITVDNVNKLDCKIVLQGANIPVTIEAEEVLSKRGILSIPDIVASAGGVICASVEYYKGTQTEALRVIEEKIRRNVFDVLQFANDNSLKPRDAAVQIANTRIQRAMRYRRWR